MRKLLLFIAAAIMAITSVQAVVVQPMRGVYQQLFTFPVMVLMLFVGVTMTT